MQAIIVCLGVVDCLNFTSDYELKLYVIGLFY